MRSQFVGSISLLAVAIAVVSCAPREGDGESAEDEARIALAPTAPGMLPAAITGDAPPPGGVDIHYLTGDTATTGYLAVPDGSGPFPAVILVHEWNGLVDRVRQMADAFAAEGYVALAADLFGGRTGSNPEENRALTSEARGDMPGVIANLNRAAAYVRARPDVTGRIAVMGWCFGGGIALSYGLDGEHHEGTAIFYGSLIEDPERLRALNHEVYGTFAEMDNGIPPDQVERFVQALRSIGVENDVHVYDDVNHGFWLRVDEEPDLRREPALDAWERLKAYLERTLGA
jgi:carboxymethylenebutenolidase